jgi:thymidylate synthase ThyX
MAKRQVYLLSPKEFSPETIAVTFAKTSRSPESFREIAEGLNEESSAKFHERWVVGYGHASVAEHAVLHIAIENVSRLAVECIESNRLVSYTEKSTRYQKWDSDNFVIPAELINHPHQELFTQTCKLLFSTYTKSLAPVRAIVEGNFPRREDESEESYDRRIRSRYVDSCRFLLPAAALANLGMTINARALEHAIVKMLSHPLAEVREVGLEVKNAALAEVPTLVKYANPLPYLIDTDNSFSHRTRAMENNYLNNRTLLKSDWCQLIDYDPDGERKVLAATLYRFGGMSYQNALEMVCSLTESEQIELAADLLGKLGEHDTPLRELEYTAYTFDLLLDQGGYVEFKRHRMMTQTPQMLTSGLGYSLPRQIMEAGLEPHYRSAMDTAAEAYEILVDWNPHVASYIVPNGFTRRILFTMNLREAFSFCQLRSASNAHYSMRRVAQRVAAEIQRVHPLLAKYLRLPNETWQEIENQSFIPDSR